MSRVLLAALLAIFPHFPTRPAIVRRFEAIVAAADAACARNEVPPQILISVGFHETHLGVDHGEGGNWGAPIDPRHRHTAGTPDTAAHALASSYRVCGSWRGAVTRFRSGLCTLRSGDQRLRYVESVMRLAERLVARSSSAP